MPVTQASTDENRSEATSSNEELLNELEGHEEVFRENDARIQELSDTIQELRDEVQGLKDHSDDCMLLITQQSQMIRGCFDTMGTMHTRLFNFIRFELASNTGQSSRFLDMTGARVAMRAFCRINKETFQGLRAKAITLRSFNRRAHRSPQG